MPPEVMLTLGESSTSVHSELVALLRLTSTLPVPDPPVAGLRMAWYSDPRASVVSSDMVSQAPSVTIRAADAASRKAVCLVMTLSVATAASGGRTLKRTRAQKLVPRGSAASG